MKKITLLSLLGLLFVSSCSDEHISAKRDSLAPWQQEQTEDDAVLSPEENRDTLENGRIQSEGGALEPDGMEPTDEAGF